MDLQILRVEFYIYICISRNIRLDCKGHVHVFLFLNLYINTHFWISQLHPAWNHGLISHRPDENRFLAERVQRKSNGQNSAVFVARSWWFAFWALVACIARGWFQELGGCFWWTRTLLCWVTLSKTNIPPENSPSQEEISIPTLNFQRISYHDHPVPYFLGTSGLVTWYIGNWGLVPNI